MSTPENYRLLADYNQWINHSLFSACEQLSDEELRRDRGAFFRSINGTLNHLLVADIIWLQRIAAGFASIQSLDDVRQLPPPEALSQTLHADHKELWTARKRLDTTIIAFAGELTDEIISSPLSYRNMRGQPSSKRLDQVLLHFFNHQTHHRGQVTTLLFQAGIDPGVTDLLVRISNFD